MSRTPPAPVAVVEQIPLSADQMGGATNEEELGLRPADADETSITGTAPPGSGLLVADATILFVDDLGVPGTAFAPSDIVSMTGNYTATTAAVCAALT